MQYQLPVAAALVVALPISLAFLFLSGAAKTKDALPTVSDGQEGLLRDPFDITKPEDFLDGTPVDEDRFWSRMRLRKLSLDVLLALALTLQCVCLGWSIIETDRYNVAVYSLHAIFALYLLTLSVWATFKTDTWHARLITNLSGLTLLATFMLTITAVLPSTPLPRTSTSLAVHALSPTLWYMTYFLYVAAFAIVSTTPRSPRLYYPPEELFSDKGSMRITSHRKDNVSGFTSDSVLGILFFSYTTQVVMLGKTLESIDIGDLPVVPADMRATVLFAKMRRAMYQWRLHVGSWSPRPGSGLQLAYRLIRVNAAALSVIMFLALICCALFYVPMFFIQQVVHYLEVDPARESREWGFLFAFGLFVSDAIVHITTGHLWSLGNNTLQVRFRLQLNSILYAKTLVRKDVASSPAVGSNTDDKAPESSEGADASENEEGPSSKAQIMTLMTTDVDRIAKFGQYLFNIFDAPLEIVVALAFLYYLLGVSSFVGVAVIIATLPLNHLAGNIVLGAQNDLMEARDERVSLMNEILGSIRMLKFMAWERSFERRVHDVRERELKYQKKSYITQVLIDALWSASPILVTLVTFWHYTVIRKQVLSPSIAFTSISVFAEMKFAMNTIPETLISLYQSLVSLRRIETYLLSAEVAPVAPLDGHVHPIALQSATVTWAQARPVERSERAASTASTPKHKFSLLDLTLEFPHGELSLICGRLGSGKSLLLLALLGEADVLSGQVLCARTPPDALASFVGQMIPEDEWIVQGICAYVPQSAWLRNASIKDNILFELPYVEGRYKKTLEVCALLSDLEILEDGDESEIGESGINLSGGQKARVSLARAVYSRASTLFLDDVLSAVDAHTAHHLYNECLKGDLMRDRTVILVSHHVQLCAAGAKFIVALDNGRAQYVGDYANFCNSYAYKALVQLGVPANTEAENDAVGEADKVEEVIDKVASDDDKLVAMQGTGALESPTPESPLGLDQDSKPVRKPPRKVVEDEKRAVGHINKDIWAAYVREYGGAGFWFVCIVALCSAASIPVLENGWLKIWSGSYLDAEQAHSPTFYLSIYAGISLFGLIISTSRWFVIFHGGIHASIQLYKKLLESVLFANIRFHDTSSRGRLLNRFGKDFEGIDSSLADELGHSAVHALSCLVTVTTIAIVGGPPFLLAAIIFGYIYYTTGKIYSQTSRDMRRLDSVTRSPLYSIYGETIAGVTVLRAFGASTKFLRDMLRYADTNMSPFYWMFGVNRWLSTRYRVLTSAVMGVTAFIAVATPSIDASLAGFALAFAATLLENSILLVHRYVRLEQSMVSVERVIEYSDLPREAPEIIEPRPPASWPSEGAIKCENLVIRYAPDLPDVLHDLTFEIKPGEKVGVLGRTGSGKSTLALSFFRFVEPTKGRILIDGLDIAKVGLTDLRSRLTIIPQDPTILSGTLRSTLDVFGEYEDVEIYEALRRVHLIPSTDEEAAQTGMGGQANTNLNAFRSLDSPVSEGGDNFSTGEKQLLCMARAILKRTKVLLMDEATASVDYATDELIGKTIRQEFAQSTILTIAHRLRTVIDYDRVMLLDRGRIVEFDTPAALLADPRSSFHALCEATGKHEFATLKRLAGLE